MHEKIFKAWLEKDRQLFQSLVKLLPFSEPDRRLDQPADLSEPVSTGENREPSETVPCKAPPAEST